eukprot:CAMPEP_0170537632 /NCGR_PEP_ID=MMETSP0209-20121228/102832_1 /TAXON_ID=665100 ORGANISM="Litonotus pictus, Strain P1" /NCGR_SAMPLE_ID=MMETSP0209 /ASSEMBLY_ACC=CAM_ASM_000301 /LENGTH=495 /DNA_ID=CAMNT_0010839169 /DNA_START=1020 /DNA_END=2504 /DNA_ORIENTATION=-
MKNGDDYASIRLFYMGKELKDKRNLQKVSNNGIIQMTAVKKGTSASVSKNSSLKEEMKQSIVLRHDGGINKEDSNKFQEGTTKKQEIQSNTQEKEDDKEIKSNEQEIKSVEEVGKEATGQFDKEGFSDEKKYFNDEIKTNDENLKEDSFNKKYNERKESHKDTNGKLKEKQESLRSNTISDHHQNLKEISKQQESNDILSSVEQKQNQSKDLDANTVLPVENSVNSHEEQDQNNNEVKDYSHINSKNESKLAGDDINYIASYNDPSQNNNTLNQNKESEKLSSRSIESHSPKENSNKENPSLCEERLNKAKEVDHQEPLYEDSKVSSKNLEENVGSTHSKGIQHENNFLNTEDQKKLSSSISNKKEEINNSKDQKNPLVNDFQNQSIEVEDISSRFHDFNKKNHRNLNEEKKITEYKSESNVINQVGNGQMLESLPSLRSQTDCRVGLKEELEKDGKRTDIDEGMQICNSPSAKKSEVTTMRKESNSKKIKGAVS